MSAYDEAREALWKAIAENVKELESMRSEGRVNAFDTSGSLEKLALAFRYTSGGAQPGSGHASDG